MSIMSFFRPRAPAEKDTDTLPLEIPTNTLGLHILHDTKTATFDVVAVHGLGGDSYRTWTEQSEGKLWLRDFLPESDKFQSARILTFGYNAKAFVDPTVTANTLTIFTFAQNLLSDLADLRTTTKSTGRPIIFIGHSLGGLVIKSVLVHAQSRPKSFGDISQSTKAIFFFATPHQGADVAAWADHLGSVTKVLGLGTSEVMAELQRWSQPLLVLATMFSEQITGIIIRTFYETLKTNGVTVVNQWSAMTGAANEQAYGLVENHVSICKMRKDSATYRTVLGSLEAVITKIGISSWVEEEERSFEERIKDLKVPTIDLPLK